MNEQLEEYEKDIVSRENELMRRQAELRLESSFNYQKEKLSSFLSNCFSGSKSQLCISQIARKDSLSIQLTDDDLSTEENLVRALCKSFQISLLVLPNMSDPFCTSFLI